MYKNKTVRNQPKSFKTNFLTNGTVFAKALNMYVSSSLYSLDVARCFPKIKLNNNVRTPLYE